MSYPTSADIPLGMWLASKLGLPLNVAGRSVFVPDEIAGSLFPSTPEPAQLSTVAPLSVLELAREICFALKKATIAINDLGIEVGALPAPPKPVAPQPANPPRGPAAVLTAPSEPLKIIRQPGGSLLVDGEYEIRPNGNAWIVVRRCGGGLTAALAGQGKDELLSWHASEQAALEWVRLTLDPSLPPLVAPDANPKSGEVAG